MKTFSEQKVKAFFAGVSKVKDKFKESHCVVPISVGQSYHENEKIFRTMELINKEFKECTVIVCDSLQRHTLRIIDPTLDENVAYKKSIIEGNNWINRNQYAIDQLTIPHKILRWDLFLNDSEFKNKLEEIENLYVNNNEFKLAVDSTIEKFLIRKKFENFNSMQHEKRFQYSLQYAKEEYATLLLWLNNTFHFITYPFRQSSGVKILYKYIIMQYFNLSHRICINFENIK